MTKAARRPPRQPMPEQDPQQRSRNFDEVALGLDEEAAVREASRCLQCKDPTCMAGCPVEIDIPGFIQAVRDRDFPKAIALLKDKNSLPAICGRVCPQETQCEQVCVLAKKGEPVAVGRLERFAADWEAAHGIAPPQPAPPTGHRVAVIGSGPGGLTAAGDLAKMGHQVTIFEAFHDTGGVLRYGIPEFRLPKAIVDREVEYVKSLGVEIELNVVIGKTLTIDDLFETGFQAVFIASGAGAPVFLKIEGENLNGVYSANEFLTRANLMKAYLFPEYETPIWVGKRAVVVGGGNVALDSARVALRLGAEQVTVVYRRSEREMPARAEEIEHAKEEGIHFQFLTNPTRILGDENGPGRRPVRRSLGEVGSLGEGGWVRAIECLRMELGEPDDSGRRRPLPVAGSEFTLDVDTVIIAIGNAANPLVSSSTPDLDTTKWGNIVADPQTGATSRPGVFAGGDIVTGAATVIEAMGAGKRAARAIDQYLKRHRRPSRT